MVAKHLLELLFSTLVCESSRQRWSTFVLIMHVFCLRGRWIFYFYIHRSPPTPLIELINLTCSRMVEIVSEAKVPFGEYLDMASDTEAQNNSLALILAWKLLVMFFRGLPQENRVEYAKYIRQNKMVDDLLHVLFRLLPLNTARAGTVVADDCEPDIGGFAGQRTIQELARNVSYSLLQWMPAIVRQWWNSLDKRRASIVDK